MFQVQELAYVVAAHPDLSVWRTYGEQVLGLQALEDQGRLLLKMDERAYRIQIELGAEARYVASGWLVRDEGIFESAIAHLKAHRVAFERGSAELCQQRKVNQMLVVHDPSGNRYELVWGYQSDFRRMVSPVGVPAFVTGDQGMGHVVLPAPQFAETVAFVRDVLGFGLSDLFNFKPAPDAPALPIHFFHCNNPRHHSLALAAFPVPSGCVHIMVEVPDMAEVGRAFDRRIQHHIPLSATLGQHTNDRMISFYMKTPSGFDVEVGTGGAQVDWNAHVTHEFTTVSLWGHDFSVGHA
ncbi:23dbph12diox, 2,3-dihydroxybiphenyl 1,2-dioxygenase [Burkholderiales bacterium]